METPRLGDWLVWECTSQDLVDWGLRSVRLVSSALSEQMLEKLHSLGVMPKKGASSVSWNKRKLETYYAPSYPPVNQERYDPTICRFMKKPCCTVNFPDVSIYWRVEYTQGLYGILWNDMECWFVSFSDDRSSCGCTCLQEEPQT